MVQYDLKPLTYTPHLMSLHTLYRVPAERSPNELSTYINNYVEGSKVTILYTSPTPAFHVLVGINMQISPSHDYHLQ